MTEHDDENPTPAASTSSTSFAAELFRGRVRTDLLTGLAGPSEDGERLGRDFLTRLETFLTDRVDPARIEQDDHIPDDILAGLGELGALGMCVPSEWDGAGLSKLYYTRALQLAGSWSPVLGVMLSAHQSTGLGQQLMLHGTPEQRRRYLPLVAQREISAFMVAEPEGGSDPGQVVTTATPTQDRSGYLLNGTKLWATNGVIADRFVVLARIPVTADYPGGVSLFIVEGGADGVDVANRNAFMGLRGIENGMVRFHNVHVHAADRIGAEGDGLRLALATINHGRLSLPAVCAAASKWALRLAREWCAERRQWGRPIGEHETNALALTRLAGVAYAQHAVVETCAMLADTPDRDVRIEAALAKLWCADRAWSALDSLVQLRGGRGYESAASLVARGERGVPAEQFLRDLRPFRIFEGTSEMMRIVISREAIRLAGTPTDPGPATPEGAYAEFGDLAGFLEFVDHTARTLTETIAHATQRWGIELTERQGLLARIVDIAAELFAMACACARAVREATADPMRADPGTALAAAFCRDAHRRVERLIADLAIDDSADVATSARVLHGDLTLAEEGILDPSTPAPPGSPHLTPRPRADGPRQVERAGSK